MWSQWCLRLVRSWIVQMMASSSLVEVLRAFVCALFLPVRWLVLLLALTFIIVVEAVAWLTFSCCRWQRCAGLTFGTVASIAWDPMATALNVFPSLTHPLLSSMWSPVVPSTCSKLDCPVLLSSVSLLLGRSSFCCCFAISSSSCRGGFYGVGSFGDSVSC